MINDTFRFKMEKDMNTPIISLSDKTGPLEDTVKRLKDKYLNLWWNMKSDFPEFDRVYTREEKLKTEKEIDNFIKKVSIYIENYHNNKEAGNHVSVKSGSQARVFLDTLTGILDFQVDESLTEKFIRSTGLFLEKIKKFDPGLDIENIYQALRNIWIMNSIQVYLGQKIDCTTSMFAYSMLYPYTDNILDNVSVNLDKKLHLSQLLKLWLEGITQCPAAEIEQKIFSLVKKIEGEFPRDHFPGVYQSLLLIFNAQLKSLDQQKQVTPPYVNDVVGISFEKGGCSVLADGFLLKGELEKKERDFCFGWGTFLQLSDDIQDIFMDRKNHHTTIFSQIAGFYKLDKVANKLFNYIVTVLNEHLDYPELQNLKKFSKKNFYFLAMEAIGKNSHLYSSDYVKEIEKVFPFSFSYQKKLRKRLEKLFLKNKKRVLDLNTVSAGLMALSSRLYEK